MSQVGSIPTFSRQINRYRPPFDGDLYDDLIGDLCADLARSPTRTRRKCLVIRNDPITHIRITYSDFYRPFTVKRGRSFCVYQN